MGNLVIKREPQTEQGRRNMKLLTSGILGVVLQGACLVAFVLTSRTSFADTRKPLVITLACLVVVLLLWRGVRNASNPASLCLLPVMLAVGYVVAFHLAGEVGFPGLLRDVHSPYSEYLGSVSRVTAILFFLYGIVTVLLFALKQSISRRKTNGLSHSDVSQVKP